MALQQPNELFQFWIHGFSFLPWRQGYVFAQSDYSRWQQVFAGKDIKSLSTDSDKRKGVIDVNRQPSKHHALVEILQRGGAVTLTGELTSCDRMTAMEIFEALGLDVSGSISSRTAFLLCGADPQQRKVDRAARLSVPVFTESEFWAAVDAIQPPE